jgi:hypothetical protein
MRTASAWTDDGISIPPPPRPFGSSLLETVRAAAASPALHQLGRVWFFTVQHAG